MRFIWFVLFTRYLIRSQLVVVIVVNLQDLVKIREKVFTTVWKLIQKLTILPKSLFPLQQASNQNLRYFLDANYLWILLQIVKYFFFSDFRSVLIKKLFQKPIDIFLHHFMFGRYFFKNIRFFQNVNRAVNGLFFFEIN